MFLVGRSLGEKSNVKDEEEKEGPSQQEIQGLREKAQGGLPDGAPSFLQQTWIEQVTLDRSRKRREEKSQTSANLNGGELRPTSMC